MLQDQMLPSTNVCIKETWKFPKQVQHKKPFTAANSKEEMKQGEEFTYLLAFFFFFFFFFRHNLKINEKN